MTNLTTAQIKTKALCSTNLLTLIDLSAYSEQVEYVKFNILFPDTPTSPIEVVYKVSNGTPELVTDVKAKVLQSICKEFDTAYDFSVSTSSVLHFFPASNKWDKDRQVMVLTQEVTKIVEQVAEVSTISEDKKDSSVSVQGEELITPTQTEFLPLVEDISTTSTTQDDEVVLSDKVIEQVPGISCTLEEETDNTLLSPDVDSRVQEVVPQSTDISLITPQVTEITTTPPVEEPVQHLLSKTSINKSLNIYVARTNSEGLIQKILIEDMFSSELFGIIKPWLVAIGKLSEFKKELQETKHNSIVLYLNPSYEWEMREVTRDVPSNLLEQFLEKTKEDRELLGVEKFSDELFQYLKDVKKWRAEELVQAYSIKASVEVNGVFHLQPITKKETTFKPFKKDVLSAYVSRITNRAGSIEERRRRDAVPELGSLENISPILVEGVYLAQSYILFNPRTLEHERVVRKIAIQNGGKFYYYSDLSKEDRDLHNIEPTLNSPNLTDEEREIERQKVEGKEIFPDLSIQMVQFESLYPDGNTLKLQHYQKTSGIWILSDSITSTDNLARTTDDQLVTDLRFVAAPVFFKGFQHPNIKVKESFRNEDGSFAISSTIQRQPTKKARLTNLSDARLVAQNSLEWVGFLANVPCIVNLVNSHDHWQLEALPIQEIPSYPLLYCLANKAIEGYWTEEDLHNQIISPLDKEMQRLEDIANKTQDPEKLEKIGRRETNLQRLRKAVLSREKLDPKVLIECTKIVSDAMKSASYRPSVVDKYYSRYILAQVYFMSTNESEIVYLLDDHMSHKRVATHVISAVQWLSRVPNNLQKQFPKQRPTIEQLRKFLVSKFNEKFREVELKVRESGGKILLDIIYLDKVQVTQVLTIKMPVSEGKNRGKVSTKVNATPNFSDRIMFEKFLRTKDGRFVTECQNKLIQLVDIFISRSFNTLVGEGKVGKQRKVSEIIGFEKSKSGWSEIKKGFVKHLLPYSSNSKVEAGKLTYLATNQVLSSQDLEYLITLIAESWSNWSRKDQQRIKIGVSSSKSQDPEILVHVLTKRILSGNFEEDKEAWQDTINWIAEVCKSSPKYRAIGFKCNNGVILTPDCIYDNDLEKWEHRIKVNLTNLLLDSNAGNIEAWLSKSVDKLYDSLEKIKPSWEETNKPVKEHLANLHDCHGISLQIERSKSEILV